MLDRHLKLFENIEGYCVKVHELLHVLYGGIRPFNYHLTLNDTLSEDGWQVSTFMVTHHFCLLRLLTIIGFRLVVQRWPRILTHI